MEELLTIKEVAEILNFKERTVRSWVYSGKLPCIKVFGGIRIKKSEVEKLLKGEKNEM